MLDWIIRYWVQWLFGLICAALLAGYRRLAKRVKEQEEERKAYTIACTPSAPATLRRAALTRTACETWNISTAATMRWAATARVQSCTTAPKPYRLRTIDQHT